MITENFSIEAEMQKILCVFRGIENEWENNENLLVEFRYYKDVAPRGEQIDSYMNDLLFGNQFRDFAHFAAIMKSNLMSFWLIIAEDDKDSSLETSFQVYFNDSEEDGPHLSEEVDLYNVRNLLWKIFDFFNNGCHLKPDAVEMFKNLVTK
jgi:hypothetical protein